MQVREVLTYLSPELGAAEPVLLMLLLLLLLLLDQRQLRVVTGPHQYQTAKGQMPAGLPVERCVAL